MAYPAESTDPGVSTPEPGSSPAPDTGTPGSDRESSRARSLFRVPPNVIPLFNRRSEGQTPPDQNQDETTQTRTVNSGPESGTRTTLRDIPGEWESVTTVWLDAPEPLSALTGRITTAWDPDRTGADVALACWAVLVLIPRGLLHLASWVLTHPLRVLAAVALAAVFLATL